MACKQPTCQQLAYLDELKQRLQELRKRQETFMEETAEILRNISPDRAMLTATERAHAVASLRSIESSRGVGVGVGAGVGVDVAVDDDETPTAAAEDGECVGNIKQLIRRFEDLRQTSRQFSDQAMPEELAGVDVRRLLNGYENLIVEGNLLQKNWLQLKKTSESCARQNNNKIDAKLYKPSSKSPSFAELT
ncbi:hypothetical protein KR222_001719, partial [Zaprionus bogoriensis]